MKCYKLTNEYMCTKNNTQWVLNEWQGPSYPNATENLCSKAWLHGYLDPVLAVLLNPIHARFDNPRLFEAEAEGEIKYDGQLKFGCQKMRLVKELALPKITSEQRVKFGILCALEVYKDVNFVKWAKNWLNNKDRSAESASEASNTAYAAYYAAYAAYAAYNAYNAAYYAAYNAAYNAANAASYAATDAANAASYAAYYTTNAASRATQANPNIDLIKLAYEAIEE
jgi:hypothetical protein